LVYGEGASGASCLFFLPCSSHTPQIVIKNQRRRRRKAYHDVWGNFVVFLQRSPLK
jgi:hypothetical protein